MTVDRREYQRQYREKHRAKRLAYLANYRKENREKIREYQWKYHKDYKRKNQHGGHQLHSISRWLNYEPEWLYGGLMHVPSECLPLDELLITLEESEANDYEYEN